MARSFIDTNILLYADDYLRFPEKVILGEPTDDP